MASTTTGLPDRYRPIDRVGPDETTETGVIQCWRAKDRVLNRDVAVRVHTPAGPAAHGWITRALTAGGLATPALAMVYDASEGRAGDDDSPGGAAYVVNEWIDGETLADRLRSGPMPEREVRLVLRRLAEGVAEAHRAGLAVGGLTLDNVVLRPNGLVGLRAVPAAAGTFDGDVTALGALLEACLTGTGPGARPLNGPSDLVALARRARSSEPGQGLSSVAAMAALLAERPRTGPTPQPANRGDDGDGRRRRLRDRRPEAAEADERDDDPVRLEPGTLPPVPQLPRVRPVTTGAPLPAGALGGDTVDASALERSGAAQEDGSFGMLPAGARDEADSGEDEYDDEDGAGRHRLVVVGLPLLALAIVIGLAFWFGSSVLSVTGSVDEDPGSTPSATAPSGDAGEPAPADGPTATVSAAQVFDPFGDGEPENDDEVPLTYDGDPATTWSTLSYRGSPAFGNLKPGVGILYDLGSAQALSGVSLASPVPGATVEIRTAEDAGEQLDDFAVAGDETLGTETEVAFDEATTARYVLVWVTGLVDGADGFSAQLGEVGFRTAG
ncbi:protein kinase family protein [Blastococcus sp. TF02A-35]|uniref:protein kinase family protein n=1 Tax=Blastococcus sp. TF02A-35 TaxID=2559612 RepID=UPI00142F5BD5|nr:protein kinase family protein [Blastococcus sp. TF02A_35]